VLQALAMAQEADQLVGLYPWIRGAAKREDLPQQNTERPPGNRHNVKSKQSAPGSNELREPFRLQSTQVIKLNQQQEAFSAMQHVRVQLRSSLKARSETVCSPVTPRPLLSFGHHYKQARCFNPDQTNTKPIDQCHLHVSSMSENVVRHRLRCHPLIRQVTLKMTGANLQ